MAVDKSNQRVRDMFGEIAPKYDRMNHLLSMNVDRYWRWRAVRKLAPNEQDPILDVCTGTGDLAFSFQKYTRGAVPVIGSDFCFEMLEIGREKSERFKQEVSFVEADAQALPFESDRFQVVSAAFGLRNVAWCDIRPKQIAKGQFYRLKRLWALTVPAELATSARATSAPRTSGKRGA